MEGLRGSILLSALLSDFGDIIADEDASFGA
jgi:hypothetical protein